MRPISRFFAVLSVAALAVAASPLVAQDAGRARLARLGKLTFAEYCRSCHGPEAKGDGPVAQYLTPKPADLTGISQRNKGVFPAEAVYTAISGGKAIKGHGNSEMPVWGTAFLKIRDGLTEEQVKERITQLVAYLETIQVGGSEPAP